MKRYLPLPLAWTILLFTAVAQTGANPAKAGVTSSAADTQIRALIQKQVDAWNRHDLEGFMAGYWHSPDLTFFSGGSVTKGWEPTLEHYRQTYQSKGSEMGTLTMSDLHVVELCPDAAYLTGRWHLTMSDGKTPHGLYTLILRRFPEGWRIIQDHTSASQ